MGMMTSIGTAAAAIGGLSLLIGLLLGLAGRLFAVHVDEREGMVREMLPGSNCGGCGYAGCDSLAKAIVNGEAPVGACPVGGGEVAHRVAEIMGVEAQEQVRQVAHIHCAGTCDKAKREYDYFGAPDCRQAAQAPGHAGKACAYACFGLGTCVDECPVGAISLRDGVAVVNPDVCISCGRCVGVCPQRIISMRPKTNQAVVCCSSTAPGKEVRIVCAAGCIACGICQKVCPAGAIHVKDNLARVDYEKCIACGTCVKKCPVQVIHRVESQEEA